MKTKKKGTILKKIAIALGIVVSMEVVPASLDTLLGQWKLTKQKDQFRQVLAGQQDLSLLPESLISVATSNAKNKYSLTDEAKPEGVLQCLDLGIQILGTQELKEKDLKRLQSDFVANNYQCYGDPRWGNYLVGHIFGAANEKNAIITAKEVFVDKTTWLPWIPETKQEWQMALQEGSLMTRIVTDCIVEMQEQSYVHVYNTHLDYGVPSIQKRQMTALLSLIKSDMEEFPLPVIVMGDWNAELKSANMKYLVHELALLNIQLIPLSSPTYQGKVKDGIQVEPPKTIDYIAVSSSFDPKSIMNLKDSSSDHNTIVAQLSYQKVKTK